MFRPAAGRIAQRLAATAVDIHALARSCNACHLERLLVSAVDCRQTDVSHRWQWQSSSARGFAAAADDDAEETREIGNEQVHRRATVYSMYRCLQVAVGCMRWSRLCDMVQLQNQPRRGCQVRRLAEEIVQLSLLEVSDLTEILQKRLGIQMPAMGAMPAGPAAAAAAPADAAAPAAEEPKEAPKTEFDIKLAGFEAASKVKIIKEVRTMTSLGLKEAKELVRFRPVPCPTTILSCTGLVLPIAFAKGACSNRIRVQSLLLHPPRCRCKQMFAHCGKSDNDGILLTGGEGSGGPEGRREEGGGRGAAEEAGSRCVVWLKMCAIARCLCVLLPGVVIQTALPLWRILLARALILNTFLLICAVGAKITLE